MQRYGVQGYPTILFIDETGKVESKIGGYEPPADFARDLNDILVAHKEFPVLQSTLKANPGDIETAAKLATIYAKRGDTEQATTLISRVEAVDPQNSKGYLTRAYNALGDSYQGDQKFDQAIPQFRKAATTGKDPSDVAYARLSIAACDVQSGKIKDAIPELQAIAQMPNAPQSSKDEAATMLKQIQAAQGSGGH